MIRSWVQSQGGVDARVSIAVLVIVSAFFMWTLWRVYSPKNHSHFDRVGAFPLDEAAQGDQQ